MPQTVPAQFVPDVLPDASLSPRRTISFAKAFTLFWLRPRCLGPHLAAGSLRRAFVAHLLSIASLVIIIECACQLVWGRTDDTASPRVALAKWITQSAIRSLDTNWAKGVLFQSVTWLLLEAGVVLLAALLMPWCSAGDRPYSAFKRSLKNVYWSTTLLVPSGLVAASVLMWTGLRFPYLWQYVSSGAVPQTVDPILTTSLLQVFNFLLFRALLTGAKECVGPPDGPRFEQWEPRCDECGYLIVGLPLESNCPECGVPVRESLTDGVRRFLPAWVHSGLLWTGVGLIREQWRVLSDREYLRRVAVRTGAGAARGFWWATFLLMVFALLGIGTIGQRWFFSPSLAGDVGFFTFLLTPIPLVLQIVLMFPACVWGHVRYGIRDYRISAAVCWYAAPLLWPMVLGIVIPLFIYLPSNDAAGVSLAVSLPLEGTRNLLDVMLPPYMAGLWVAGVLALPGLLFWWIRVSRGLRAARYANV